MAISKTTAVVLSDQIDKKQVRYMNKDYSEFKKSLVDFAKFYFPDTYQDFSDASPGSIFIDMAAYIGDVLSYYTDNSFKESLLALAEEKENIVSIAQGLGFKPRLTSPSYCNAVISALVPADVNGDLDVTFLPKIAPGSIFNATTQYDAGQFLTQNICDFNTTEHRTVQVFSLDPATNLPTTFIVSKTCKLIAATEKSIDYVVGSPEKFLKIQIPDDNIVEILSVVDSEGNTWYEVDNLSQDYRFEDKLLNTTQSDETIYSLTPVKVNRRFVTRLNRDMKVELIFGSGVGDLNDVWENPDYKSVYDQQYLQNMTNVALDTLNFTNSNSFGLAPGNTTLTVKYSVSNGLKANVPSGTITKIGKLVTLNETRTMNASDLATFNTMISSITVINQDPANGGLDSPTPEQIRQAAIGFVNAQGRVVTRTDYEKRILSMPSKYGAIAKAFVIRDDAISFITGLTNEGGDSPILSDDIDYVEDNPVNTNVNVYILGYNSDRRLTTLNTTVKQNLKRFLKGYRMLTDRVSIFDAFRVSIAVDYSITVYDGFNIYDVLSKCSDSIAKYFDIDNWQINQPIIMDDVLLQIAKIEGVRTVTNLTFKNKYQQQDGRDYAPHTYNMRSDGPNISNRIIYPSADPCIFEIRYPQDDITGTAIQ